MGFFGIESSHESVPSSGVSLDFMHKHGCQACPLNRQPGLKHPYMKPTGSAHPLVYIIAEAPGEEEDLKGIQLIGRSGQVLRFRVPESWNDKIRWSNVVRCRPRDGKKNRAPTFEEVECCRGLGLADIELTKPKAIFGFGNVPLSWALGVNEVTLWAGRRVPVRIGQHICWYFPMLHPSYVLRSQKFTPNRTDRYGSDIEFAFAHHLRQAFAAVESLPEPKPHTIKQAKANVEYVTGANGRADVVRIQKHLEAVAQQSLCGLDIETQRKRPYYSDSRILTIAIAGEDHTLAFPVDHPKHPWPNQAVHHLIYDFLMNAQCRKAVHHLAFELEWLAYFFGQEIIRAGKWGDSMVQAYTLDERPGSHSLEFVGIERFGINLKSISNLNRDNLVKESLDAVLIYNGIDAKYHRLAYIAQSHAIKDRGLMGVYKHLVRRVPTFALTQLQGVPVDQREVAEFRKLYEAEIEDVERKIAQREEVKKFRRLFSFDFRPSSNQDVGKLVRQILGHPVKSVDEEDLLEVGGEFVDLILAYRKACKSLSTYVTSLAVGSKNSNLFPDGLLHYTIGTRTRTSRTSASEVNVQNFHKRGPQKILRRQVQKAGYKVWSIDYAGIQARNVAMESRDRALVKAFWERYNIHLDWMERLVKLYPKWITEGAKKLATDKQLVKDYRSRAKNEFVFPSFFGAQGKTVAGYLGVPEHIGVELSSMFWDEFPDIKKWHDKLHRDYHKHGYVTGLAGFRRNAPISANQIINSPIQALEALIVCEAMCRLSELDPELYQAHLMIHDDLSFIWPDGEGEKRIETVITEMLKVEHDWINTPLEVEVSMGSNWAPYDPVSNPDGLKEVGVYSSDKWSK